jgi:glycine dehydrogenase subunit 1
LTDTLAAGYFAGIPLAKWYPEMKDCLLVTVTEKRTSKQIDGLIAALSRSGSGQRNTVHA